MVTHLISQPFGKPLLPCLSQASTQLSVAPCRYVHVIEQMCNANCFKVLYLFTRRNTPSVLRRGLLGLTLFSRTLRTGGGVDDGSVDGRHDSGRSDGLYFTSAFQNAIASRK